MVKFTLIFLSRHTGFTLIRFLTALILSGSCLNAQNLKMPERWATKFNTASPLYKTDTLTIRVLGDIMMHEKQITEALRSDGTYGFGSYFSLIEDKIRDADIAIANMEFTLAGEPYTGYPAFSAPDSFADYLAGCGFDIFLAANNHIFDKGTAGAVRTIKLYRELGEQYGIRFTGIAGDTEELENNFPLFIRSKGIIIALLNFTYGTNLGLASSWPKTNFTGERARIGEALSKAVDSGADFILALPHWGTEYALHHSESQEETAVWLAENGAECIIGSHPHVVQDCGRIDDVSIVYSLGNAVSNMSAANTQIGLMATIRIVREGNGDIRILPVGLEYLWCSRPGGYNDSYTVIPVMEFIGRKQDWKNQADYWKMITTYERVKTETEIYQ